MRDSNNGLKDYLLYDFKDPKHDRQTLLDIFVNDPEYFEELVHKRLITAQAASFCAMYEKKLKDLENIKAYAFKQLMRSSYIDEFLGIEDINQLDWNYVNEYSKEKKNENIEKKKTEAENKQVLKNNVLIAVEEKDKKRLTAEAHQRFDHKMIYCPNDKSLLSLKNYLLIQAINGKILVTPLFQCLKCKKYFISTEYYKNFQTVRLNHELKCTNLRIPSSGKEQKKIKSSTNAQAPLPCYFYISKDSVYKAPDQCWVESCQHTRLIEKRINVGRHNYLVRQCPRCGTYYILKGLYDKHPESFQCLEKDPSVIEKIERNEIEDRNRQRRQSFSEQSEKHEIEPVDVVVKSNTFRCIRKGHTIEQITAVIPVITPGGQLYPRTVPAGYCRNCRTYFIRESTYESLRRSGVPVCGIEEENIYLHGGKQGIHELAEQSVLMQHGYNVSSKNNLSAEARHQILSLLMEYKILSRSEIINYLEFFISQRAGQKKNYEDAISKWQEDIRFVRNHSSSSRKVNVRSIKHKNYYKY